MVDFTFFTGDRKNGDGPTRIKEDTVSLSVSDVKSTDKKSTVGANIRLSFNRRTLAKFGVKGNDSVLLDFNDGFTNLNIRKKAATGFGKESSGSEHVIRGGKRGESFFIKVYMPYKFADCQLWNVTGYRIELVERVEKEEKGLMFAIPSELATDLRRLYKKEKESRKRG
jgi:hypothetical protein